MGIFCLMQPTTTIPREDEAAVMRLCRWREVPVLVLDDVGAEKPTPRALEVLFKRGSTAFMVACSAPASIYDEYADRFEWITGSFRLLD